MGVAGVYSRAPRELTSRYGGGRAGVHSLRRSSPSVSFGGGCNRTDWVWRERVSEYWSAGDDDALQFMRLMLWLKRRITPLAHSSQPQQPIFLLLFHGGDARAPCALLMEESRISWVSSGTNLIRRSLPRLWRHAPIQSILVFAWWMGDGCGWGRSRCRAGWFAWWGEFAARQPKCPIFLSLSLGDFSAAAPSFKRCGTYINAQRYA